MSVFGTEISDIMNKNVLTILILLVVGFVVFSSTRNSKQIIAQAACVEGDINADGKLALDDFVAFRTLFLGALTQTPTQIPMLSPTPAKALIPTNPKIMPLGDSITVGMHGPGSDWAANHSVRGGYRQKLQELLTSNGTMFDMVGSVTFVDETMADKNHEGHGGWCIAGGNSTCFGDAYEATGNAGLIAHIDAWMTASKPDVILLNIGTNDFGGSQSGNMINNYAQLIDKILTNNPAIFLFVSSLHIQGNTSVAGFNTQLQTLAQQKAAAGKHVYYVDVWAGMTPPLHEGTDTLHPTLAGYEVMGQNWFNALKPFLSGGTGSQVIRLVR